jgi:hypothetical protein
MLRELEELSARIEVLLGGWILSRALTREAITSPLKQTGVRQSFNKKEKVNNDYSLSPKRVLGHAQGMAPQERAAIH